MTSAVQIREIRLQQLLLSLSDVCDARVIIEVVLLMETSKPVFT